MLDRTSQAVLEETLTRFSKSLESGDINTALELFQDDCYWRDLVTFTWNLRTMEGKDEIRDMLTTQLARIKPASIRPATDEPAGGDAALVEGWIEFETEV